MNKASLIVCNNNSQLFKHWIESFKPDPDVLYTLATENLDIRNLSKEYSWISSVFFIEKISAFFSVAKDVLRIRDSVNNWLLRLSDSKFGFPNSLFYFNRHVEGGYTSQRLQDLLLLINSYSELISKTGCNEIILLRSESKIWEDNILVAVANSFETKLVEVKKNTSRFLLNKAMLLTKSFFYEPFYFLQFLQLKLMALKYKNRYSCHDKVVFQLCSSARKHVDNLMANMVSLKDGKYPPVVLSWGAAIGIRNIIENKFEVHILEKSFSFISYIHSLFKILYTWILAKKNKSLFLRSSELEYSGVQIGELLWFSIRHFVWAELGNRWRIYKAARAYFRNSQPLAISPWGINDLPEGRMIIDALREHKRPLIFKYYLSMVMYETPYREIFDQVDLYLVGGLYQYNFNVKKLGIAEHKNVIVGQARYDSIKQFQINTSRSDSLRILKIPDFFELYILFDYSNALRGYISTSEVYILFNKVLDFTSRNNKIALLIKPHPNANIAELKSYKLPDNVFLLDKNALPYHGLNVCDIFITKYSTVGFESMLFNKPVLSVILDGETAWRVFGNAVDYINNVDELDILLDKFLSSNEYFFRWKEGILNRQNRFISEVFGTSNDQSSVLTAKAIYSKIDFSLNKTW